MKRSTADLLPSTTQQPLTQIHCCAHISDTLCISFFTNSLFNVYCSLLSYISQIECKINKCIRQHTSCNMSIRQVFTWMHARILIPHCNQNPIIINTQIKHRCVALQCTTIKNHVLDLPFFTSHFKQCYYHKSVKPGGIFFFPPATPP